MKKILCVGSVTTDIIVSPVDRIPPPGTLQAVEGTSMHVGGCASNASIDLARLGVPVALSCRVGSDSFGSFVLSQAGAAGVDVSGVVRGEVPTTSSIVCVNSEGERSFLYHPGSTSVFLAEDIPVRLVEECDILFVAGAMLLDAFDGAPCARLLAEAREKGKYTAMDTAWDASGVWLPKIEAALDGLDLFLPSYEEACRLSGEQEPAGIADFFLERGVKSVVVKLGKEGAYFRPSAAEKGYTLPTYRKIRPVDTTGAGDSFCAGFLCGLAQGWDFARCGAFANAVGTHCIQAVGASAGIPPIADILHFMETTPLE